MARRGRKRQLELETEYWRLLAWGVGTVEACKAVGIGRKAGDLAHARAREGAPRPRRNRLSLDEQLRQIVQAKLELEWSLEQIAAHLRSEYPDRPDWHLCHETIW